VAISLVLEHVVPEIEGSILDFTALPEGRAVAVTVRAGAFALALIEATGVRYVPIDAALLPGLPPTTRISERAVLCRVGSGFALVASEGVAHWASYDARPRVLRRDDRFPANAHGFTVQVASGAASDDPGRALVLLREPQRIQSVTRYAWLRLDQSETATWEGLAPDGDPRWLPPEAFPPPLPTIPTEHARPILFHGDWRDGRLRLFVVGSEPNYVRWGMTYAMAVEVRASEVVRTWTADETCFGTFSTSGRYLLTTPSRKNGPSRGASSAVDLASGEHHAFSLPRGLTRYEVADHAAGRFWLRARHGDAPKLAIASTR
jgi:hypothetical protein